MTDSRPVKFPETSYGIVKRWQTIDAWTTAVSRRLGKSSLSVLDYGCGTGDHVTYPLACRGHRVLGVDFHDASVREASRRYQLPALSFRTAEIEDLLKQGERFDLVVCSEVLEHLREPRPFLEAINRLLAPGGGLIVTTPNGYGAFEWLTSLQKWLAQTGVHGFLRRVAHACSKTQAGDPAQPAAVSGQGIGSSAGFLNMDSTHVQFFRVCELEDIFSRSGFHILERRARTLFCGPYADVLFRLAPFEATLCRANNRLADLLPFSWAADWMFLLERRGPGAQ